MEMITIVMMRPMVVVIIVMTMIIIHSFRGNKYKNCAGQCNGHACKLDDMLRVMLRRMVIEEDINEFEQYVLHVVLNNLVRFIFESNHLPC